MDYEYRHFEVPELVRESDGAHVRLRDCLVSLSFTGECSEKKEKKETHVSFTIS